MTDQRGGTDDGRPAYVFGDGTGYVSRLADTIESLQLGMARDLLDRTADLLGEGVATSDQLRFTLARMSESLRDAHRIAESRGARLPVSEDQDDEDDDDLYEDGTADGTA